MNRDVAAKIEIVNQNAGMAWNKFVDEHLVDSVRQFNGRPFLTEELREIMEPIVQQAGLPIPDGRAWGNVLRRAQNSRLVEKVGHAPARSSHFNHKVLWQSVA